MKTCLIEGCACKVKARGMCDKHYGNWLRKSGVARTGKLKKEEVLAELPASSAGLRKRLGCCRTSAMRWIRVLRAEIHIVGWEWPEHPGPAMPIYAKGAGEDAPFNLQKVSRAEQKRRYMAKHAERVELQRKAEWICKKATSRKATWASALGVMA